MAFSIGKQEKAKNTTGKNIGIDLGTANILVYVEGEGIVTNEPSVVAFDYETNEVLATGQMAADMIGKGHHGIKIVSPLNQGVISDIEATKKLIEISLHLTNLRFKRVNIIQIIPLLRNMITVYS